MTKRKGIKLTKKMPEIGY